MISWILASVVVIFAIVVISAGVKVVPQSETRVIERLGRFHSVLSPGLNFIIPFIDKPKTIYTRRVEQGIGGRHVVRTVATTVIDLREQVYDFPSQQVITRDNVTTEINALLYFQITDPKKAVYEIDNLPNAIEKLTQTSLRNVIGELELDETLTSRDTINTKLQAILDDATNKWGVKVNRVELQDITPPAAIREAMEKQMKAERDRRAMVTEAEGTKTAQILKAEAVRESEIKKAEGLKQAAILQAEGVAEAKIKVAQAEAESVKIVAATVAQSSNPASYMISLKYIEALTKMTDGKDNKIVYMPYEASNVLGAVAAIKDLTGGVPTK